MRMIVWSGVVAILSGCLGCSGQTANQAADSARAKCTLMAALEAWKSGHVESLSTRSPAIRLADDDQIAGMELVDYELDNEAAQIKPFENVRVVLSLRDRQGQTSQKSVTYQVGVTPKLTVIRSDN